MIEVLEFPSKDGHWDSQAKELAYEVYSKQCDGDMVCTLNALDRLDIQKIPEKTVYDWRKRYGWDARLQGEKQAVAPYSWNLYFGGLSVAAPELVSYLRSVVNDNALPHRDRIAAAGKLLSQIALHIEELSKRGTSEQEAMVSGDLSTEELLALTRED